MDTKDLLTKGLQAGFADSTNRAEITLGSFHLTTSSYEEGTDIYYDHWVYGGGQEYARTEDGQALTRVYVGNTIAAHKLEALGITEKDVMKFLKDIITEHGKEIRLDNDFAITQGDWLYTYKVTFKREDPYIINGIEEIYYKEQSIFVHTFGISKILED